MSRTQHRTKNRTESSCRRTANAEQTENLVITRERAPRNALVGISFSLCGHVRFSLRPDYRDFHINVCLALRVRSPIDAFALFLRSLAYKVCVCTKTQSNRHLVYAWHPYIDI